MSRSAVLSSARALLESGGHLLGWCVVQAFSPTTFVGTSEPRQASITYFDLAPNPEKGQRRSAPGDGAPPRSGQPLHRKGGER